MTRPTRGDVVALGAAGERDTCMALVNWPPAQSGVCVARGSGCWKGAMHDAR